MNQDLHKRIVRNGKEYEELQRQIVFDLQAAYAQKLYLDFEQPSLFVYAENFMGLSPAAAYCFTSVAKKALLVPVLQTALVQKNLSVWKAQRLVSTITIENSVEWVEFAQNHTQREIDKKVSRNKLRAALILRLGPQEKEDFDRYISMITKGNGRRPDYLEAFKEMLKFCTERVDPSARKKRREARKAAQKEQGTPQPAQKEQATPPPAQNQPGQRVAIKIAENDEVRDRNQNRCAFVDSATGKRCPNDSWLEIHHLKHVKDGGTNDLSNLTLYCGTHHDLVHQIPFNLGDNHPLP